MLYGMNCRNQNILIVANIYGTVVELCETEVQN